VVFVSAFAETGTGYKSRFVVLVQQNRGWPLKLSCRIVDTAVEERHRHRSIGACHKPLVGYCQYKSSRQYQHHLGRLMKLRGTLSTRAVAEGDYSHQ